MSAVELDAVADVRQTERQAEAMVQSANEESARVIAEARKRSDAIKAEAEALLAKEAQEHSGQIEAETNQIVGKMSKECDGTVESLRRAAGKQRKAAIERLKAMVVEWQ